MPQWVKNRDLRQHLKIFGWAISRTIHPLATCIWADRYSNPQNWIEPGTRPRWLSNFFANCQSNPAFRVSNLGCIYSAFTTADAGLLGAALSPVQLWYWASCDFSQTHDFRSCICRAIYRPQYLSPLSSYSYVGARPWTVVSIFWFATFGNSGTHRFSPKLARTGCSPSEYDWRNSD